jgi:tRNA(fMet)-specific endonuclease VapC
LTILDTNTIIHYLKGEPGVTARIQVAGPDTLAISTISVYELENGALRGGKRWRSNLNSVVGTLQHIPFDSRAAFETAQIRFELERKGAVIGPLDLLIAGIAMSRNAILVSNNTKEFARVKGLRLEDWRK